MNTTPTSPQHSAAVDAAIATRRSVRGFLPTPVPREPVSAFVRFVS